METVGPKRLASTGDCVTSTALGADIFGLFGARNLFRIVKNKTEKCESQEMIGVYRWLIMKETFRKKPLMQLTGRNISCGANQKLARLYVC